MLSRWWWMREERPRRERHEKSDREWVSSMGIEHCGIPGNKGPTVGCQSSDIHRKVLVLQITPELDSLDPTQRISSGQLFARNGRENEREKKETNHLILILLLHLNLWSNSLLVVVLVLLVNDLLPRRIRSRSTRSFGR